MRTNSLKAEFRGRESPVISDANDLSWPNCWRIDSTIAWKLLFLLDFAHRDQHDEERQQQRHHVAERDDPFGNAGAGSSSMAMGVIAALSPVLRSFGGTNVLSFCSMTRGFSPD